MRKLLIAEGNDELRQALVQALDREFIVQTCTDGESAQRLAQSFRPDLLVLDLMLPCVDGITLLHRMAQADIMPITLVTLAYQSPFILAALEKYGVAYAVSKPCDWEAVACQVRFLGAVAQSDTPAAVQEQSPSGILLQLGFSPRLDGYKQLLLAIPRYMEDPGQNLTKELYNWVGHAVGKTALAAERSMRHAICAAWARADMEHWRRYFPAAPDGTVPKPSVGSFISHIAAVLAEQHTYQKRA